MVPPAISTCRCGLEEVERRLDDREVQAQAPRQLAAGQLSGKVQRLQRELHEQIEAEPGFLRRRRRGREVRACCGRRRCLCSHHGHGFRQFRASQQPQAGGVRARLGGRESRPRLDGLLERVGGRGVVALRQVHDSEVVVGCGGIASREKFLARSARDRRPPRAIKRQVVVGCRPDSARNRTAASQCDRASSRRPSRNST